MASEGSQHTRNKLDQHDNAEEASGMATLIQQVKGARRSFAPGELRRLAGFYSLVALLHIIGWGTLVFLVAPKYPSALGIGVGITAYLLGLRHAFDADHIAAIDNSTRKMMADGKQPLGVGFFFSLGHSTVVLVLSLALAFAAQQVAVQVASDDSALRSIGGLIGTGVSGFFLLLIALLNIAVLVDILRIFVEMRKGKYDEEGLNAHLDARGFMNRFLGRLSQAVSNSWQMYPIGFLFGLGFDTASEVALLALAAGAASTRPWRAPMRRKAKRSLNRKRPRGCGWLTTNCSPTSWRW